MRGLVSHLKYGSRCNLFASAFFVYGCPFAAHTEGVALQRYLLILKILNRGK